MGLVGSGGSLLQQPNWLSRDQHQSKPTETCQNLKACWRERERECETMYLKIHVLKNAGIKTVLYVATCVYVPMFVVVCVCMCVCERTSANVELKRDHVV